MKKNRKLITLAVALIAAYSFTGCSSDEKAAPAAAADPAAVLAATDAMTLTADEQAYCELSAQAKAASAGIAKLDADLKAGSIDQSAYDEQKKAYETALADAQSKADAKKAALSTYQPAEGWVDTNNTNTLEDRLAEIAAAAPTVATDMEAATASFVDGSITEAELIEKLNVLEKRSFLFETQTVWLEDYLHMLEMVAD